MYPFTGWRILSSILLLVLVLTGCGTSNLNLVSGSDQRGAYSWAEQVELGTQADPQIIAQYGLLDDPEVASYVDRIGQDVLQSAFAAIQASIDAGEVQIDAATFEEVRRTPFYFRVLDTPMVNAFALPGGYTYYTRGILTHFDNEAQLAMVIGHELGHVLAQHSSRRAFETQRNQFGLLGAAIAGTLIGGDGVGQNILEVGSTGLQLLALGYSREAEREADRAGVAYSEFADYDAAESARFFDVLQRMQAAAGGAPPTFLSTHPDPVEREQTIRQLATLYNGTRVNAGPYLDAVDGLVLGENPREGFAENGVFYQPELAFQFDIPRGWRVNNTRQAVILGEPNGNASFQFTFAGQSSASAAARELSSQQGVTVTGQQNLSANGNPGVLVEGQAAQQGGSLAFLAGFVEYGGNVYQMLGISRPETYNTYGREFSQVIQSFARLTDRRLLNRQPVRLDVVEVTRTAPFSSFLAGRPEVPGMDANDLAILNQVELNDTIRAGTLLKLPR